MNDKDNQIIELHFEIEKKNQELAKIEELVEQKVRQKKAEYEKLVL